MHVQFFYQINHYSSLHRLDSSACFWFSHYAMRIQFWLAWYYSRITNRKIYLL